MERAFAAVQMGSREFIWIYRREKKHLLNNYGGVLEAHGYKSCPHAERFYTFPNKNATRTEVLSESSWED